MNAPPSQVVKDMALSFEEFRRSIAVALKGETYEVEGERVTLNEAGRQVVIAYRALPERRLGGLLALPRGEVTIDFTGYDEAARTAFLQRFDLAFQRGGG